MNGWICEDCGEPWPYRAQPEDQSACNNCGGLLVRTPPVVRQHGNLDTGAKRYFGGGAE